MLRPYSKLSCGFSPYKPDPGGKPIEARSMPGKFKLAKISLPPWRPRAELEPILPKRLLILEGSELFKLLA